MAEETKKPTARQRHAEVVKAYKHLFNLPEAKLVINDLMKRGNMMSPTMSKDPNQVFHSEGKRDLVLYILSNINVDNETLAEMIKDSRQEDRRYGL